MLDYVSDEQQRVLFERDLDSPIPGFSGEGLGRSRRESEMAAFREAMGEG